jgi:hypothetical protein
MGGVEPKQEAEGAKQDGSLTNGPGMPLTIIQRDVVTP